MGKLRNRLLPYGAAIAVLGSALGIGLAEEAGKVKAATAPTGNLTPNFSFEESSLEQYWSWKGTLARKEVASAPDGKYVAAATNNSSSNEFSLEWENKAFKVTSGQPYTATAYVAAGSSSEVGKTFTLNLRETTTGAGSTTVGHVESSKVTLSTSFQKVTVGYTGKTSGDHLDLYGYSTASAATDVLYADEVTVVWSGAVSETINITNAPCVVESKEGTCSGTFTPKPKEETATEREARERREREEREAREKREKEEREKEEREAKEKEVTSGPHVVAPAPKGVTGEYKLVYGDTFNGNITGWTAKSGGVGCCGNSNEGGTTDSPAQVKTGAEALELDCAGSPGSYTCSRIDSNFTWKPLSGGTFVFETVAKVPSNSHQSEDPGWWTSDRSWTDEIDFFEYWGWNHTEYYVGVPCWLPKAGGGSDTCSEHFKPLSEIPRPESEYHYYTTVVKGTTAEEYIDGVHRWNISVSSPNTPAMNLILTHGMREASKSTLNGTSVFAVKSVAVYEDKAHAGTGITNGGLAPGTTEG